MTDPTCARCGARLLEYRGAWFGPGDETTCPAGDRHAPTPVGREDSLVRVALLDCCGQGLRAMPAHAPPTELDPSLDAPITAEMRARADAVVDAMRARWAARDAVTDQANRAFDVAFRRALRRP